MIMDYLWTPWRYQYVSNIDSNEVCPFCLSDQAENDTHRLVVYRGELNFVILNLYPYTSGHLLVSPYAHISDLAHLSSNQLSEMMLLAQRCKGALERSYRPDGFNIGMNLGRCAGAGVDQHIHLHVVPRWMGDSNFMTIAGETRVLPESLDISYQKIKKSFESL
jgi:ATP adenylyltransferase